MPSTQISFRRINPAAPAHLLGDDELQTASNIDLSLGAGAIVPRRGCTVFGTINSTASIVGMYRLYNDPSNIFNCPFYVRDSSGIWWRGSGTSWTAIATGSANSNSGISGYENYAVIADFTVNVKDDGTNTTEWVKQNPGAPSVTVGTLTPLDLLFSTATFAVTEGTAVAGTSTITASPSANSKITLTVDFGGAKDLNTNSGNTIGDYGVHFIDLAFNNPTLVTRISQDYSIGDSSFKNYWHAELSPQLTNFDAAQPDAASLVDAQIALGTSTIPLSRTDREDMISALRDNPNVALGLISRISDVSSPWGVARTDFSFVGSDSNAGGTSPWSGVYAVRYTFEVAGDTVQVVAANPTIAGGEAYCLTDLDVGYSWWQTYATFDSLGRKIGESAPGPASSRVRCQNANAVVALTGTATGLIHGITHVITYRQGGYTRDAYAVSTDTYTGSFTSTDTMADLKALSLNYPMPRNIYSKSDFVLSGQAISAPWNGRVFVANGRDLNWSLPDQIDSFSYDGRTEVGPVGDDIKALIPWTPGLVIINQYSVYEFQGGDLDNGDWQLTRSGSKHGSIALRVPCATPYGIPLLNYDGLTLYMPGQGEVEISWLMELYGDLFRGGGSTDPAALKGARIPAINRGYLDKACACYAENKLFLAVACNSQAANNFLFVIDFTTQRVWWYQYQFNISTLFWDYQDSRLFAGTTDGRIMQLETGVVDHHTSGTNAPIVWDAQTRAWAAASDTVFQNVAFDAVGEMIVQADYDGGSSPVIGTISSVTRQWFHVPLDGSFARSASYIITGTKTSTTTEGIYQLSFDSYSDPERVRYFRTPYDDKGSANQKVWDVANYSLEILGTGPVQAVTFVDGIAVMAKTFTGPTARLWNAASFPVETYGKIAYTTYTSSSTSVLFKVWDGPERFEAREEPPQVSSWRTDIQSLDEAICDAFDTDINPAGTAFGTVYIDNTATTTGTFIGNARQSYTTTIPVETYGRTLYVLYSGTNLKHYNTWFHRRDEPDRWTSFVSPKRSGEEHEWKVFTPEIVCYGLGTCSATVVIDGTAVSTHLMTNTTRQQHTFSLPYLSYGRSWWVEYHASSGSTFKYYSDDLQGDQEPSRVTLLRVGPYPLQANSHIRTLVAEVDPLGSPVYGTFYANSTAISTATITGSGRRKYEFGLDIDTSNLIQEGRVWEVRYAGASKFKHYSSDIEAETMPFEKYTWAFHYKKLGGSSQIDLGRFWSLSYNCAAITTCTYWWDLDGINHHTGTLTLTSGHGYVDRIPFKYGAWGRLFELRLRFSTPTGVDSTNIELLQQGVKGLSVRGIQGAPASDQN